MGIYHTGRRQAELISLTVVRIPSSPRVESAVAAPKNTTIMMILQSRSLLIFFFSRGRYLAWAQSDRGTAGHAAGRSDVG